LENFTRKQAYSISIDVEGGADFIVRQTRVRILETGEVSYQEKGLKNVRETRHCQFLLPHSINTSLETSVP